TTCAQHGLSVMLVDEQPSPGGQVYRGIGEAPLARRDVLGADFAGGVPLVDAFMRSGADYSPQTTVWSIAPGADGFDVALRVTREPRLVHARAVVIATGALERPFPIPGSTLPGVMLAES